MIRVVVTLTCIILSGGSVVGQEGSAIVTGVDSKRFQHLVDSLDGEIIIDLRTPEELKQGKIPGATVIDFFGPDFERAIEELDKNKVYLLYCAGGGRSGETAEIMQGMGFKKVYDLEEGFNGWAKKKMPVARE